MDYEKLAHYQDELPETAKELIEVIGLNDTLKLVRKYGGTHLLIPKVRHNSNAISYLVDVIGEKQAFKLIEHYRGTTIYLPKCDKAVRSLRNAEFFKAVDSYIQMHKASQDEAFFKLCPQFNITYRMAFYIIKAEKIKKEIKKIKQNSLF